MRQKPIGEFIVDFYCSKLRLIIEIDGYSHRFKLRDDVQRQEWLERLGLTVLRFEEREVIGDLNKVLQCIERWILENQKDKPRK